jgi:hypothetical protein
MSVWDAVGAIGAAVSGLGVSGLVLQLRQSDRAMDQSELTAYGEARGRMDAAAPRVEVHVAPPVWPPLGASQGVPQPWPGGQEWHFPRGQEQQLLLKATVTVTNRSPASVHVEFAGDLWEAEAREGRVPPMRAEMLLGPDETVETVLRGGLSMVAWARLDAQVRAGQEPDRWSARPSPCTTTRTRAWSTSGSRG